MRRPLFPLALILVAAIIAFAIVDALCVWSGGIWPECYGDRVAGVYHRQ